MDVYLLRHGEARAEQEDPERPLTEAGRAAVERVARRFAALDPQLNSISHSGILRARQTAEILAAQLRAAPPLQARDGLRPLDAVAPVADWLLAQASDAGALALVGHLPFLERLASRLVTGDEARHVLSLPAAGLVKLVPAEDGDGFTIAWELPPELA
jgi:phosphohistidine phosphatase